MKKHKLLTKEIEKSIPALYSTENVTLNEKKIAVKYFDPYGKWSWLALEGERTEDGDFRFFGLVDGHEKEYGYWMLSELESIPDPYNRKQHRIERDVYYTGTIADYNNGRN